MNDALYVAATGMQAQQTQLTVIANNVANVNTPGFKRSQVNFHNLVQAVAGMAQDDPARASALQLPTGAGVAVSQVSRQFTPGELRGTDSPMDVAIDGAGFLEVLREDGQVAYSRGGPLRVNAEGLLATAQGQVLKQRIQVPSDAKTLLIASDGQVTATDGQSREWNLGRLELVTFANPSGLTAQTDNLFVAGPDAGDPLTALPGEGHAGRLRQGQLETSNVKLVDEMVQLMVAQRAYEMNVKLVQAADEIAGMTNNLRK